MSKIYKAEVYIIDFDEEMDGTYDVEEYIKYRLGDIDNLVSVGDIEESKKFVWHDNLKINLVAATKEDYEKYFNNK